MNLTGRCCSPRDQWSQGLSGLREREKKSPPARRTAENAELPPPEDFGVPILRRVGFWRCLVEWPVLRCAEPCCVGLALEENIRPGGSIWTKETGTNSHCTCQKELIVDCPVFCAFDRQSGIPRERRLDLIETLHEADEAQ